MSKPSRSMAAQGHFERDEIETLALFARMIHVTLYSEGAAHLD
ncbi:hypothetical protein [Mesorhizobium sp. M1006]